MVEYTLHHMNAIRVIHPYLDNGVLAFDDPAVGLVREPFIMGADRILIRASIEAGINPKTFTLIFSDRNFPGHQYAAAKELNEMGGAWYRVGLSLGWLCPALLKYFDKPPEKIFFQIKARI